MEREIAMSRYDAPEIEARWQRAWDEAGLFRARRDPARPKYYVLEMFPYPSGASISATRATTRWAT